MQNNFVTGFLAGISTSAGVGAVVAAWYQADVVIGTMVTIILGSVFIVAATWK